MTTIEIPIINKSNNPLPQFQTAGAAGMDICAFCIKPIILKKQERILISTGLFAEIPDGYEGQIRSRSGLALKYGIMVLNSPGTIDSDYRGELKVLLYNTSDVNFHIKNGDRIAQLVVHNYSKVNWKTISKLNITERSEGGYGHTGV